MTDDQKRIYGALEFWRLERERVLIEIAGSLDGNLKQQRWTRDGWVDITAERQGHQTERLHRMDEIIGFFEGLLRH